MRNWKVSASTHQWVNFKINVSYALSSFFHREGLQKIVLLGHDLVQLQSCLGTDFLAGLDQCDCLLHSWNLFKTIIYIEVSSHEGFCFCSKVLFAIISCSLQPKVSTPWLAGRSKKMDPYPVLNNFLCGVTILPPQEAQQISSAT